MEIEQKWYEQEIANQHPYPIDPDIAHKMDIRRRLFEEKDIERLLKLHHDKFKQKDYFGASKVAWILSAKHSIN